MHTLGSAPVTRMTCVTTCGLKIADETHGPDWPLSHKCCATAGNYASGENSDPPLPNSPYVLEYSTGASTRTTQTNMFTPERKAVNASSRDERCRRAEAWVSHGGRAATVQPTTKAAADGRCHSEGIRWEAAFLSPRWHAKAVLQQ